MNMVSRAALALVMAPILERGAPAAIAQGNWPERPVKIVFGFAPGSATDVTVRMFAQKFGEAWGQPVVVDTSPATRARLAGRAMRPSPCCRRGKPCRSIRRRRQGQSGHALLRDTGSAHPARGGRVAVPAGRHQDGAHPVSRRQRHRHDERYRTATSLERSPNARPTCRQCDIPRWGKVIRDAGIMGGPKKVSWYAMQSCCRLATKCKASAFTHQRAVISPSLQEP